MIVLGLILAAGGLVGYEVTNHQAAAALATLAVAPTSQGMVATATGAGGDNPTAVLTAAKSGTAAKGLGSVPTTPVLYLPPAQLQDAGVTTGSEAAYWRVWWDGATQTEAVVSLQQHLDGSNAQTAAASLVSQNSNPGNFQMKQLSTFALPGVPGSSGYVWLGAVGSAKSPVAQELRFATFYAGSRVALVSMTAYGHGTDAAAFEAFATAEYNKLNAAPDPTTSSLDGKFIYAVGIGALVLLLGIVRLVWTARRGRRIA